MRHAGKHTGVHFELAPVFTCTNCSCRAQGEPMRVALMTYTLDCGGTVQALATNPDNAKDYAPGGWAHRFDEHIGPTYWCESCR